MKIKELIIERSDGEGDACMCERATSQSLCIHNVAAILLLGLSGVTSAWAADFDIDRASYIVDRDRLLIRCDAEDDETVRLFDADSNVLFDTVTANSDGKWLSRKNNPEAMPCRVRAESKEKSDERDVRNASRFPGGCGIDDGGGNPPPPSTGQVSINSTSQNGIPGLPVIEQLLTGAVSTGQCNI